MLNAFCHRSHGVAVEEPKDLFVDVLTKLVALLAVELGLERLEVTHVLTLHKVSGVMHMKNDVDVMSDDHGYFPRGKA